MSCKIIILILNEKTEDLVFHTNGINFTIGEKISKIPEGQITGPSVRCGQYCTDEYLRYQRDQNKNLSGLLFFLLKNFVTGIRTHVSFGYMSLPINRTVRKSNYTGAQMKICNF
jgi:hypothetical protein